MTIWDNDYTRRGNKCALYKVSVQFTLLNASGTWAIAQAAVAQAGGLPDKMPQEDLQSEPEGQDQE